MINKILKEEIGIKLTLEETIIIVDNMYVLGNILLETITNVGSGKEEMLEETLERIKRQEANCRFLMSRINNQIPDDIAQKIGIKKTDAIKED